MRRLKFNFHNGEANSACWKLDYLSAAGSSCAFHGFLEAYSNHDSRGDSASESACLLKELQPLLVLAGNVLLCRFQSLQRESIEKSTNTLVDKETSLSRLFELCARILSDERPLSMIVSTGGHSLQFNHVNPFISMHPFRTLILSLTAVSWLVACFRSCSSASI